MPEPKRSASPKKGGGGGKDDEGAGESCIKIRPAPPREGARAPPTSVFKQVPVSTQVVSGSVSAWLALLTLLAAGETDEDTLREVRPCAGRQGDGGGKVTAAWRRATRRRRRRLVPASSNLARGPPGRARGDARRAPAVEE